jgi:hypothetical protein
MIGRWLVPVLDIYGSRDRLTWTPRADQWMLFQEASLR